MAELEGDLLGEQDLETLLYLIKNVPPNWGKNRLRVCGTGWMGDLLLWFLLWRRAGVAACGAPAAPRLHPDMSPLDPCAWCRAFTPSESDEQRHGAPLA